jgi:putative Ca2+/H+ antiporter (TMEM165/GDT1 family)
MDWKILLSVFGIVFVAELPDKTAVATLVLASRHRALPVFVGSALALTVQSAIAVAAGGLVAKLPRGPVHTGTAIVFLFSAVWMWMRKEDDDADEKKPHAKSFARVLASTFAVVFVAEWGDLTQIATAALAARHAAPFTVFVAATAALWAVSALAVLVGNRLAHVVSPKTTKRVAAVVFAIVGAAMLAGLA